MATNYCYLLECRLMGIVYRTNLMASPFEIIRFIKDGHVLVDFKPKWKINYLIPVGEIFTFSKTYEKKLLFLIRRRLKAKAVYFNVPKFLFMSYKFMFGFLMRFPKSSDIIYPIRLDIQRLVGYF
jgi:ribosomal protein S4